MLNPIWAFLGVGEVPGGWVVPVVFGGGRTSVQVTLRVPPDLAGLKTARALHPGSNEWVPVTVNGRGAALTLDVPLVRGCAIVRLDRPAK